MYILEVIPLTSLPPNSPQILSYFYNHQLPKGAVVEVPLGKRKVHAVVISSTSVEESKISIKKTSFQLKKISQVINEEPWVSQAQLNLANWIAHHYYASLGMSLKTVLPPFLGTKKYTVPTLIQDLPPENVPKIEIFEASAQEENKIIQSRINKKGQILIIFPERTILDFFVQELRQANPIALHSRISKAKYAQIWQTIASGEAQLILGTRTALFAPFKSLTHIILDDPLNEAYKSDMAPRYDAYDLAKKLASMHNAQLTTITPLLNSEEYHLTQNKSAELMQHYDKKISTQTVDMIEEIKSGNFSLFSRPMESAIIQTFDQQKPILIYSARRAYTGTLLCLHCGFVIRCQNCDVPMRVHKTPASSPVGAEVMTICYHCSSYQSLPTQCPNCKSIKLQPAGVPGSQKIQEQLEALLLKHNRATRDIFIFDSDLIRTPEQELMVMNAVEQSPAPIVIATQMILSYRHNKSFSFIGIPSVDALASNSDFRTDERLLYQIRKLNDFNPENFIVQTFNPTYQVFQDINRDLNNFYSVELEARKLFHYPPFARLIKLEYRHPSRAKAIQASRLLSEKIKMIIAQLHLSDRLEMLGPYPAFIAREKNYYIFHIILKIRPELEKLDTVLKYVPSDWLIDVDPKSIV